MKKDNVLKLAAAIGAVTLMVGGVVVADAAMNNSINPNNKEFSIQKEGRQFMSGLSEEEKTAKLAEVSARREANRADRESRRELILAAINSGDYNSWKSAVGENHPFYNQINVDNFTQFADAHKDMNTLEEKLEAMGLEKPSHDCFDGMSGGQGQGQGRGLNQGHGRGQGQLNSSVK